MCTVKPVEACSERDILVFPETTRESLTKCYGLLVSQSSMGTISFHCGEKSNGIELQIMAISQRVKPRAENSPSIAKRFNMHDTYLSISKKKIKKWCSCRRHCPALPQNND